MIRPKTGSKGQSVGEVNITIKNVCFCNKCKRPATETAMRNVDMHIKSLLVGSVRCCTACARATQGGASLGERERLTQGLLLSRLRLLRRHPDQCRHPVQEQPWLPIPAR
jgi:hypothetical protein